MVEFPVWRWSLYSSSPLPAIAPRARSELAVTDFTWQVWCEDKMPIFTTITGRDSSRLCSRYITFHHHHLATHKAQRSDVIMSTAANHQLAAQTCNYFSAPGWSLRGRELIWWEVSVLGSGQWLALRYSQSADPLSQSRPGLNTARLLWVFTTEGRRRMQSALRSRLSPGPAELGSARMLREKVRRERQQWVIRVSHSVSSLSCLIRQNENQDEQLQHR